MNIKNFLLINLLNGFIGIILLIIGYKIFDFMTPRWDFSKIFSMNKVTNGSVVIASFLIGLSIIIGLTAN
jgi:uncharacterized membrane protein YjfL (UPF0719 family)